MSRALLHLSKLPTAAVYAASELVMRPLSRLPLGASLVKKLFYSDYLDLDCAGRLALRAGR